MILLWYVVVTLAALACLGALAEWVGWRIDETLRAVRQALFGTERAYHYGCRFCRRGHACYMHTTAYVATRRTQRR